jgi:hypothetical protein
MFNDIWSLGIILLNLATGRNPWKSATPDDQTFQAYLRDPLGFLPTVLPISPEINDILTRMLEVDWRERMTLRELRHAIEDVNSFYSDGVVFEGSMARCPWESGMDIDSQSSEDTKEETPPPKSDADFTSHWSKESSSDIVFASHSVADDSSYGAPWTNFSSCGATYAFESPTSSISRHSLEKDDRASTPVSPVSSAGPSLPVTPNSLDLIFGDKAKLPARKGLTIETDFSHPRYYNPNASMATSFSTGTSMMQTAVEYDPYSPSFFLTSAVTQSSAMPISMNASATSMDDKEMISPSIWASSATEMSSPSIYSSSNSSIGSGDMSFTRSTTPSPDTLWSDYRTQVQCLPQSQPSQHSASIYAIMTDVIPPSRPSNPAPQKPHDGGSKHKATSIFNPIKFFPRASPPPSSSPPSNSTLSHGRHSSEPFAAPPGNKAHPSTSIPPAWSFVPQPKAQPPNALQFTAQDQRVSHLRSPRRRWFTPGKFFASTGAQ